MTERVLDLAGPKGYEHNWIYVGGPGLPLHNPYRGGGGKSRRQVVESPKLSRTKAGIPKRAGGHEIEPRAAVRMKAAELRGHQARGSRVAEAELNRRAAKRPGAANGPTPAAAKADTLGRRADRLTEKRPTTAADAERAGHAHMRAAEAWQEAGNAPGMVAHHEKRAADHRKHANRLNAANGVAPGRTVTPENATPAEAHAKVAELDTRIGKVKDVRTRSAEAFAASRDAKTPAEHAAAAKLHRSVAAESRAAGVPGAADIHDNAAARHEAAKPKRKPSSTYLEYQAAKQEQDRRFEDSRDGYRAKGKGKSAEELAYFGEGEHMGNGVEKRVTYRSFLDGKAAGNAHERQQAATYKHARDLGIKHAQQSDTSKHDAEYNTASEGHDEETFGGGYTDGLIAGEAAKAKQEPKLTSAQLNERERQRAAFTEVSRATATPDAPGHKLGIVRTTAQAEQRVPTNTPTKSLETMTNRELKGATGAAANAERERRAAAKAAGSPRRGLNDYGTRYGNPDAQAQSTARLQAAAEATVDAHKASRKAAKGDVRHADAADMHTRAAAAQDRVGNDEQAQHHREQAGRHAASAMQAEHDREKAIGDAQSMGAGIQRPKDHAFTTGHQAELQRRLAAIPPGTPVTARQPGIERPTHGVVAEHKPDGSVVVAHRDRHDNTVRGTFNVHHVAPRAGEATPEHSGRAETAQVERATAANEKLRVMTAIDHEQPLTSYSEATLRNVADGSGKYAARARSELARRGVGDGTPQSVTPRTPGATVLTRDNPTAVIHPDGRVTTPQASQASVAAMSDAELQRAIDSPTASDIAKGYARRELSKRAAAKGRPGPKGDAGEAPAADITQLNTFQLRRALTGSNDAHARAAEAELQRRARERTAEAVKAETSGPGPVDRRPPPPGAGTLAERPGIRVEHSGDGTVVYGTERGDTAATAALKEQGFKWSRNLDGWYLPRSWGEATRDQRVKALQSKLGDRVAVQRGDLAKSGTAAEQQAARVAAAERNAETNTQRAARARAEAEAQFQRSHDATAGIPFGQPILVGHHSQRRHENAIAKSHAAMRRGVDASAEAGAREERAASAAARARMETDPRAAARRLDRNEAEHRKIMRSLQATPAGEHHDRLDAMRRDLEAKNEADRATVAAAGNGLGKDNVKPGDVVVIKGQAHVVTGTGSKNVKVLTSVGHLPYPYHQVQGHKSYADLTGESTARLEALIESSGAPETYKAQARAIISKRKG